jgi:hypothetical protein
MFNTINVLFLFAFVEPLAAVCTNSVCHSACVRNCSCLPSHAHGSVASRFHERPYMYLQYVKSEHTLVSGCHVLILPFKIRSEVSAFSNHTKQSSWEANCRSAGRYPPLDPVLSQMNQLHTLTYCLFVIVTVTGWYRTKRPMHFVQFLIWGLIIPDSSIRALASNSRDTH